MTAEDNKTLVETAWRAYCAGDYATAFARIAEDVHWIINARIPGVQAVHDGHAAMRTVGETGPVMFPLGLQQEVQSVTGDGDTVAMEYTMKGVTAKGRTYENNYCIVCTVNAGKIVDIREYTDTYHIAQVMLE